MIVIILAALIVAFWLGVWADHVNFVRLLQESETELREGEAKLRKELKETRLAAANWQHWVGFDPAVRDESWIPDAKQSFAHFDLTEPKIERRGHSDVFKIDSIDALIVGTK